MSLPDEPLRLNESDLYSPRVDAYLEEQAVLQRAIPEAAIYVFDNNSTDNTGMIARDAGAIVMHEKKQGKARE